MCMYKRVVYIMGTARSGTTLLDVMLGNALNSFSCGEIIKFPWLKGQPHGFREGTGCYNFWKNVELEYIRKGGLSHSTVENISKSIESHGAFVKTLLGKCGKKNTETYAQYIEILFQTVSEMSQSNTLIDSSKYPGRAIALSGVLGNRLKLIYLTRSRKDIVSSFAKKNIEQPSKRWLSANLYYFVITSFCRAVVSKIGKQNVVTMTLEELQRNPVEQLMKIQTAFKIDMSRPIEVLKNGDSFKVGYLFEGNRIRLQENVHFEKNRQCAKRGKEVSK